MGGGAGRGKFKGGPTGKRSFSTPEEMASGTTSEPKWRMRRQEEEAESEEEEEEEEVEAGEDEEEKAKGVSGLIQIANPNAPTKSSIKVRDAANSAPAELSRREREELAKQQATERYMKLQEQGKTDQSKKDLERLAMIRQQRAEAAKKREEEKQAKEAKKTDARK